MYAFGPLWGSRERRGKLYQSVLIAHGFLIYEFAYSLKCICNPRINTHSTFVICGHVA